MGACFLMLKTVVSCVLSSFLVGCSESVSLAPVSLVWLEQKFACFRTHVRRCVCVYIYFEGKIFNEFLLIILTEIQDYRFFDGSF